MRSLLVGAAALFLVAGPAVAKDLEGAAPVVEQWAGAYAGIHGGYGQANRNGCFDLGVAVVGYPLWNSGPIASCSGAVDPFVFDYGQSGPLVGLQVGYNWQAAQSLLLGVELSASATGMNGWLNDSAVGGQGRWSGLLTATAKAGVTKGKWLFYAEGGYALAEANFAGDLACDFNMNHSGPVAGAGIGMKLSPRLSLDLKYDHIWLDAQQAACNLIDIGPELITVDANIRATGSIDVVKLGLNFALGN